MASKASRSFIWIILILVMFGLGGYGATNFGRGNAAIGSVGSTEISANRFFREVNSTLRAVQAQTGQPLPIAQAEAFGLTNQALQRVIAAAAFDNENKRLGISVGDDRLRQELFSIQAFQDSSGRFSRDQYENALRNSGLTPPEFEANMRADLARGLLQTAVAGGVETAAPFTDTLFAFAREMRDFTWAKLDLAALETQPDPPSPEALQAWYEAHPDAYTLPEIKKITVTWLRPEVLLDSIKVDEAELKKLYDARADEYNKPERRLVERLVFANETAAQDAMDAIKAGETTFAKLVEARGLQLSDTDLGDMTEADLGEAGPAIFALSEPGVVGPLPSGLGPALYNMNAILAAQHVPFADVRSELRLAYAGDAARRAIGDMITDLDDQLAGGVTLEELAGSTPGMELVQLDWTPDMTGGIAAYEAFQTAASAAQQGDFPTLEQLSDGGLFALRVDEIDPPRLKNLDEVRDDVTAAVLEDERLKLLQQQAQSLLPKLENEGESLASLGLAEVSEISQTRNDIIEGTPPALLEKVFAMQTGEWAIITDADGVILAHLDRIIPADASTSEAVAAKAAFSERVAQEVGLDIESAYGRALQDQAGITLNQAVIKAVLAQFP